MAVASIGGVLESVIVQKIYEIGDPSMRASGLESRRASKQMKAALLSMGFATEDAEVHTCNLAIVRCQNMFRTDVVV